MIASVRGRIIQRNKDSVVIDVNGVGYEVLCKISDVRSQISDEVTLWTHMAVSENNISLFGFENQEDLNVFKLLITVSGVGPKTGMAIMREKGGTDIMKAIGGAEVEFFQKIKGIGKKTAQRIIVDLKSRIGGLGELDLSQNEVPEGDDLYLSLKQLGFVRSEIDKVVAKLPKEEMAIEKKIEWCLRNVG